MKNVKMNRSFFLLAVLAALFAFSACKKNSYDDFALAYAELRIAEREYGNTEDGRAIRFQILQKHGLSAENFETEAENLKKEPEKWQEFQNRLIKILDSIASSSKSKIESESESKGENEGET